MARDPGLQPERTALSWQRTGVVTLFVGGLTAAAAVRRGDALVVGAALVALALAGVTAVPPRPVQSRDAAAHSPAHPSGRRPDHPPTRPYARLVRAALATVALAAVGVLLALS